MRDVKCVEVRWGPDGYGIFDVSEDGVVLAQFKNRGKFGEGDLQEQWLSKRVSLAELKKWARGQLTVLVPM
jgi:hypothetical protein